MIRLDLDLDSAAILPPPPPSLRVLSIEFFGIIIEGDFIITCVVLATSMIGFKFWQGCGFLATASLEVYLSTCRMPLCLCLCLNLFRSRCCPRWWWWCVDSIRLYVLRFTATILCCFGSYAGSLSTLFSPLIIIEWEEEGCHDAKAQRSCACGWSGEHADWNFFFFYLEFVFGYLRIIPRWGFMDGDGLQKLLCELNWSISDLCMSY